MTEAALFRRCRRTLGLSQPTMARALLIAQDRTIRRWERRNFEPRRRWAGSSAYRRGRQPPATDGLIMGTSMGRIGYSSERRTNPSSLAETRAPSTQAQPGAHVSAQPTRATDVWSLRDVPAIDLDHRLTASERRHAPHQPPHDAVVRPWSADG